MNYRVVMVVLFLSVAACSDDKPAEVEIQEQPVTENLEGYMQDQLEALKKAKNVEQFLQDANAKKRAQVEAMTQ